MDGAAADKADFLDEPLHGEVVPMGVDAKVAALLERLVEAEGAGAAHRAVRGDAVDDAVGRVVGPVAVLDDPIGRFSGCRSPP